MATFKVNTPDGKTVDVDAPEGATPEQAIEFVAKTWKPSEVSQQFEEQKTSMPWSQVPEQALKNLPEDIKNIGRGTIGMVSHPIDTATGLATVARGAMQKALPTAVTEYAIKHGISPEARPQFESFVRPYIEDFGSVEGLKKAIEERPASTFLNITGASQLGQGLARKVAGSDISNALRESVANAERINALNAPKAAILKAGQEAGYVVPPSSVAPTFINQRLEGIAGKAAIKQHAQGINQEITNALARKALGLPEDQAISHTILADLRKQQGGTYREIAELPTQPSLAKGYSLPESEKVRGTVAEKLKPEAPSSVKGLLSAGMEEKTGGGYGFVDGNVSLKPATITKFKKTITSAAQDLESLKQTRNDAQGWYESYKRSANPEELKKAKDLDVIARGLDAKIANTAKAAGRDDLRMALHEARKNIAKTYTVEKTLNLSTGDVSANVIGGMVGKGKPLTEELKTIGQFQQAYPQYIREGAKVPAPGVSKLEALSMATMGMGGMAVGGPTGALMGLTPLLSTPIRNALLSKPYQKMLANALKKNPSKTLKVMDDIVNKSINNKKMNAAQIANILQQINSSKDTEK